MTAVTVAVAAEHLGITKEAVRKRISRGTLHSDKGADGVVRVYIPVSRTTGDAEKPTSTSDALISEMRDRLRYVEGQLEAERQAHAEARRIIAGLVERIPALEAPESPERPAPTDTPTEAPSEPQEGVKSPWWRRMFGS